MYRFEIHDNSNTVDNARLNRLLIVQKRINIPSAEEIIESTTLGDGSVVYKHTGIYKERDLVFDCAFIQKNNELWNSHFSEIQNILLGKTGKLVISDDSNHYWNIKKIKIDTAKRELKKIGKFSITFTVEPFRYISKYLSPLVVDMTDDAIPLTVLNEYRPAEPLWRLTGNAENITIRRGENDNGFIIEHPFVSTKNVSHIDVDTEKWTCMRYYSDGSCESIGINTIGYYDWLNLGTGENTFIIEKNNGDLKIELYERLKEF